MDGVCYIATMERITKRQLEMLKSYDRDGEAADFADFDNAGTLAWRNRERVIEALIRKGLLSNEQEVTEAGREALAQPK